LTLHRLGADKQFWLPDDCQVVLRDGKIGSLADLNIGHRVTVTYETPDKMATARQIAETSLEFAGALTAIDLEERTVKARAMFTTRKFNVADDCAIVVNGEPRGRLSDLRPEQLFVFHYEDINGISVVNRIAPMESPADYWALNGPMPGF
jgi:hypothetical protein